MFVLFVPVGCYRYEGGGDGAFAETEEETHCSEAGEVFGGGETHADGAPDYPIYVCQDTPDLKRWLLLDSGFDVHSYSHKFCKAEFTH